MPGREQRSILALLCGALALVIAWIAARGTHSGASQAGLDIALGLLLVGPAAVLPQVFRSRHPGVALSYAVLVGGAFAAAASWLGRAGELVLAGAYYAVPGIFVALAIGLLPVHWRDRQRKARSAREAEARTRIGRLRWRLWTGSAVVEDAEILEAMGKLAAALPDDNEQAAAAALFGAAASLAARRPELREALLAEPVRCMARLGVKRAETVLEWLDPTLLPWPVLDTDEAGRQWLENDLPGNEDLLQRLLDAAMAERSPRRMLPGPRALIGEALMRNGRWEEAARLYAELVHEGDPHGLHRFALARAKARAGDPAEAVALLAEERWPTLLRARLAALVGRRELALELLEQALLEHPMLAPEAEPDFATLLDDPEFQHVLRHRYQPEADAGT